MHHAKRDSLANLLHEANAIIINRDAKSAGTHTEDKNIYQGWAEVRGRSKRFYSWKKRCVRSTGAVRLDFFTHPPSPPPNPRFIVFEADARRLTIYSSKSLLKQHGTFVVTDCNIPLRNKEAKFWQRSLRLDLAVSDVRRSPLSLNVLTSEAHTSWLRLFKRDANDLDITVDESTRQNVHHQRLAKNKTTKTKKSSLTDVQNQIAQMSNAPMLKKDVRVTRSDRPGERREDGSK